VEKTQYKTVPRVPGWDGSISDQTKTDGAYSEIADSKQITKLDWREAIEWKLLFLQLQRQ
jgi:hypothetical protein